MDHDELFRKVGLLITYKSLSKINSSDDFETLKSFILNKQLCLFRTLSESEYIVYLDNQLRIEEINMLNSIDLKIGSSHIDDHYNQWMQVCKELTEEDIVSKKGYRRIKHIKN